MGLRNTLSLRGFLFSINHIIVQKFSFGKCLSMIEMKIFKIKELDNLNGIVKMLIYKNPSELVWARVKGSFADQNIETKTMEEFRDSCVAALEEVSFLAIAQ